MTVKTMQSEMKIQTCFMIPQNTWWATENFQSYYGLLINWTSEGQSFVEDKFS